MVAQCWLRRDALGLPDTSPFVLTERVSVWGSSREPGFGCICLASTISVSLGLVMRIRVFCMRVQSKVTLGPRHGLLVKGFSSLKRSLKGEHNISCSTYSSAVPLIPEFLGRTMC